MSLAAKIFGYLSGNGVEADTNGNLLVNVPTNIAQAGFTMVGGQVPGTTGLNQNRPWNVSSEGRGHAAIDRPVIYVNFNGSATAANAIPQDVLKQTATTMTATAGSTTNGFLLLNASAITTLTTGIAYQTYTPIPTFGGFESIYEFEAVPVNCNSQANKCVELGAGFITSATSVGLLDGFCFRWTTGGTFIGVMSINGTEYSTSALVQPTDGVLHRFSIRCTQIGLEFYVDQILQAVLAVPVGLPGPGLQANPPVLMRLYNTTAPALAPQIKIAEFWVTQGGMDWQKPWSHIVAGMSQHSANVPFGQAIGESAVNYLNSTAIPAAAAGSNTAALSTGLGGHYQITAQVTNVAAAGENIITSYQIPAQTATQASKRFICTGVHITGMNNGAVVATTATTLLWGIAWGHTAISLATADAVNAKAPRHMKVGTQTWAIGAVIGATAADINVTFATPFVVNPGEFIASTCRFLVGTATASQAILGAVTFEGYWE
jgi:hypothetical protein